MEFFSYKKINNKYFWLIWGEEVVNSKLLKKFKILKTKSSSVKRAKENNKKNLVFTSMKQSVFKNFLNNYYKISHVTNPWNIVDKSPWPFYAAFSGFFFTLGLVTFMHGYNIIQLLVGVIMVAITFYGWLRDIIREGTFLGKHTSFVRRTMKTGFIFFIASELMLFISFFWGFYNFMFTNSIETGFIYPPTGMDMSIKLPSIMNLILIMSGLFLNLSHIYFKTRGRVVEGEYELLFSQAKTCLVITILLGFIFVEFQAYEYVNNSFTMSDTFFGGLFYILTGCHSLHVIIGVIFLLVSLIRMDLYHTNLSANINYDLAVWYWHFVDFIWIFLYFKIYYLFYYLTKNKQLLKMVILQLSGGEHYALEI
jgi:cytochrome c oxidase subunit 3